MIDVVNPKAIAQALTDFWSPKVVGELDNNYIKVAKVQGEFTWHAHDDEDELFYVLEGELNIAFEDKTLTLKQGDMHVIPKGVRHKPFCDESCLILLIEKKTTLHTGGEVSELTRNINDQLT